MTAEMDTPNLDIQRFPLQTHQAESAYKHNSHSGFESHYYFQMEKRVHPLYHTENGALCVPAIFPHYMRPLSKYKVLHK